MNRPRLGSLALVRDTFRLFFGQFGRFFPVAFVPALALSAFAMLAGTSEPVPLDPVTGTTETAAGFGALFLGLFLEILVGFVVSGVLTLAAIDAIPGDRRSAGTYLRETLQRSGPILVLGTLLYLLAGIGLALFILPGFYVLARFLPWLPAILAEDAGWSGLTRAQELTQGQRLPLGAALALFGALAIVATLALGPIVELAASAGPAILVLVEAAATALYYGLAACLTALAYVRLRESAEGMGPAAPLGRSL